MMSVHRLALTTVAFLFLAPHTARGNMVYSLVDHPADQVDPFGFTHHLSGTITTDGMLGTLTSVDILSWEVTFDGSSTLRSTDPDAETRVLFGLIATQDSLSLPSLGLLDLHIINTSVFEQAFWSRTSSGSYQGDYNGPYDLWQTSGPAMGGTDPWQIATHAVPEPSSAAMAGMGALCVIAYSLRRRDAGA